MVNVGWINAGWIEIHPYKIGRAEGSERTIIKIRGVVSAYIVATDFNPLPYNNRQYRMVTHDLLFSFSGDISRLNKPGKPAKPEINLQDAIKDLLYYHYTFAVAIMFCCQRTNVQDRPDG
jgi:hypothetical protein